MANELPVSPALEFLTGFSSKSSQSNLLDEGDNVDEFVIGTVLTSGSSALVRNAKHLPSSTAVAVRIVHQSDSSDFSNEVTKWSQFNHQNILPLLHHSTYSSFLLTFSPICTGSLLDHVKKYFSNGMSVNKAHSIFSQIAQGVSYLHDECSVVHRDLKLENVLLDSAGNWVISDFGLSQSKADTISQPIDTGSLPYASPELIRPPDQTLDSETRFDLLKKADIWALGCILYALLSGKLPFSDAFVPRLRMKILGGSYQRLTSASRSRERSIARSRSRSRLRATDEADELAAIAVLEMCLNPDTSLRPLIDQLLENTWVNGIQHHYAFVETTRPRMHSRSTSRNRSSRSRSQSRARGMPQAMYHLSPVEEKANSSNEEEERGRPTIKRSLTRDTNTQF